jgi:hypothetical protein
LDVGQALSVSIGSNTHVVWGSLNMFCRNGWSNTWELVEYRITAEEVTLTAAAPDLSLS